MEKGSRTSVFATKMRQIKFTKTGLEKIQNEHDKLLSERPNAVKELVRARELGDLSENGLYHAAKARLRSMDSQLRRMSNQIKLAEVVPSKNILVEQNGKQIEYQIVGDFEADPSHNKISSNSPIGSSILGKKPGEEVVILTPKGELKLKILKML